MLDIEKFIFPSASDWDALPLQLRTQLYDSSELLKIPAKKQLFREASKARHVYFVERGMIKAHRATVYGEDQILFLYAPGEFFGHRPFLGEQPHPLSATTIEPTTLRRVTGLYFSTILRSSPVFSQWMIRALCREYSALSERITVFTQYPVLQRVCLALLIIERKYRQAADRMNAQENSPHIENVEGVVEPMGIDIKLSRTHLAQFVGTSLETVVRCLKQLEKRGIIVAGRNAIRIAQHEACSQLMDQI